MVRRFINSKRDFIQSNIIGIKSLRMWKEVTSLSDFLHMVFKTRIISDRAARIFNMMMKSEKSLMTSFKLFQRSRNLKKDSTCEECWSRLKAVCCEEWRICSHKNWCKAHLWLCTSLQYFNFLSSCEWNPHNDEKMILSFLMRRGLKLKTDYRPSYLISQ